MIGFRLGDLNVVLVKNIIVARCSTTKINQIKLIKNLFSPYTSPHTVKEKCGKVGIAAHLNKSFLFLLPKQDYTESWILENPEYFWAFFAGYSDAEGYLCLRKEKNKNISTATFGINSYDKNILHQLYEGLTKADIKAKLPSIKALKGTPFGDRGYAYNHDMWRLVIDQKQSLWKLIHYWEIFSKHKDKLKAIEKIKRNILLRNQLPRCHKIDLSAPKSDGEFRPT